MYDPIQTRLNVLRSSPLCDYYRSDGQAGYSSTGGTIPAIHDHTTDAYAGAWGCREEDGDSMIEDEHVGLVDDRRQDLSSSGTTPGLGGKGEDCRVSERTGSDRTSGGNLLRRLLRSNRDGLIAGHLRYSPSEPDLQFIVDALADPLPAAT